MDMQAQGGVKRTAQPRRHSQQLVVCGPGAPGGLGCAVHPDVNGLLEGGWLQHQPNASREIPLLQRSSAANSGLGSCLCCGLQAAAPQLEQEWFRSVSRRRHRMASLGGKAGATNAQRCPSSTRRRGLALPESPSLCSNTQANIGNARHVRVPRALIHAGACAAASLDVSAEFCSLCHGAPHDADRLDLVVPFCTCTLCRSVAHGPMNSSRALHCRCSNLKCLALLQQWPRIDSGAIMALTVAADRL